LSVFRLVEPGMDVPGVETLFGYLQRGSHSDMTRDSVRGRKAAPSKADSSFIVLRP
jgi:hypothetical protein